MIDATTARTCRCCGCDDANPCMHELYGPCIWIESDLCSHCHNEIECDQAGRAERQLIEDMSDEGLGYDDPGPWDDEDF